MRLSINNSYTTMNVKSFIRKEGQEEEFVTGLNQGRFNGVGTLGTESE